jgi:hypothetical protein
MRQVLMLVLGAGGAAVAWLMEPTHRGMLIAILPTVITGFLRVKGLSGVARFLALILRLLSIVTPKDVRGTWQAPLGLWELFRKPSPELALARAPSSESGANRAP